LIILDVDSFKKYNDSFGHPAGDRVLKQVAKVLVDCARESDLVARYGGEEFVAILPNTNAEGALIFAERMRFGIEHATWKHQAITVSIGVATLSGGIDSGTKLLEAADRALYASKAAG